MEGPSLVLAREQLAPFTGKEVLAVAGNTKVGKEVLLGKQVREIFSWGKHLVFQFDTVAMRVHFMLFGTFQAEVEGAWVTGDYRRKAQTPRLVLEFANGRIEMYSCSVKFFEDPSLKSSYDFSTDVLAPEWDPGAAYKKIMRQPDERIDDILLDQEIFAGVGNIIKNEILFLARVRPERTVRELTPKKRRELIALARSFSRQFYEWRKVFLLKKNLVIYRKPVCPVSGTKVVRAKTGKRQRWSFWCPVCQK